MNYIYEFGNRFMVAHGISVLCMLALFSICPKWKPFQATYLRRASQVALLAALIFLSLDLYHLLFEISSPILLAYRREQWIYALITTALIPGMIVWKGWHGNIRGTLLVIIACNVVALRELVQLAYPVYYPDSYQAISWRIRVQDTRIHYAYTQAGLCILCVASWWAWVRQK